MHAAAEAAAKKEDQKEGKDKPTTEEEEANAKDAKAGDEPAAKNGTAPEAEKGVPETDEADPKVKGERESKDGEQGKVNTDGEQGKVNTDAEQGKMSSDDEQDKVNSDDEHGKMSSDDEQDKMNSDDEHDKMSSDDEQRKANVEGGEEDNRQNVVHGSKPKSELWRGPPLTAYLFCPITNRTLGAVTCACHKMSLGIWVCLVSHFTSFHITYILLNACRKKHVQLFSYEWTHT